LGALFVLLVAAYLSASLYLADYRVRWQIAITDHPFVISDLYPRWAGARAMLAGRNPYSAEVTAELQRAYYGQTMAPEDEREHFGTIVEFFYPPYVVLPLLPLLWLPFEVARWLTTALLGLAVAGSALLWWRICGGSRRPAALALVAGGSLLFYPSIDLITLQQLTGLVLLEVVAAFALAARGRFIPAGALLALAMIKPQNALLPAAGLLFWSLWRPERRSLPLAFGAVMAAQLLLAQVLVPRWIGEFIAAGERYGEFNRIGYWLPGFLLGSTPLGVALIAAPVALLLCWHWWRCRRAPLTAPATLLTAAATFGAVVVLLPDISFYNKVFLLPPLLTLATMRPQPSLLGRAALQVVDFYVLAPALAMAIAGCVRWYIASTGASGLSDVAGSEPGAELVGGIVHLFQIVTNLLPLVVVPTTIAVAFQAPSPRLMEGEVGHLER
jgi:hypothetical protein